MLRRRYRPVCRKSSEIRWHVPHPLKHSVCTVTHHLSSHLCDSLLTFQVVWLSPGKLDLTHNPMYLESCSLSVWVRCHSSFIPENSLLCGPSHPCTHRAYTWLVPTPYSFPRVEKFILGRDFVLYYLAQVMASSWHSNIGEMMTQLECALKAQVKKTRSHSADDGKPLVKRMILSDASLWDIHLPSVQRVDSLGHGHYKQES